MTYDRLVRLLMDEGFTRQEAEFEADVILGTITDEAIDDSVMLASVAWEFLVSNSSLAVAVA